MNNSNHSNFTNGTQHIPKLPRPDSVPNKTLNFYANSGVSF